MSNGIAVASVNPLAGNDANSVENAAMGFTEDLARENEPRRRETSNARSRRSGEDEGDHLFPDVDSPDADTHDDGHAEEDDPLRDDILDDPGPKPKENEGEDDGEDEDEGEEGEDEENPEGEDDGEDGVVNLSEVLKLLGAQGLKVNVDVEFQTVAADEAEAPGEDTPA